MIALDNCENNADAASRQAITSTMVEDSQTLSLERLHEEVIERLKAVTGSRSERELSVYFGYNPTGMTNKRKRGSVPYDECVRLALEHGISLDWLILGRGNPPPIIQASQSRLTEQAAEGQAAAFISRVAQDSEEFVSVPLYDIQAAAGTGRLFEEERIKHYVHFRRDWLAREGLYPKDLACIEVEGDSMAETLHDRDTVLVNRSRRTGDGVYFLRMGEALRVKRLQWRADRSLRLSSDNEMYAPETIHPENLGQVEILGHCHWRGGKIY